jgi:hypothetical protein
MRKVSKATKVLCFTVLLLLPALAAAAQGLPQALSWPQWGRTAVHNGSVPYLGQAGQQILAQVVYDPFTAQENVDPLCGGGLCIHYQTPLIDNLGQDVYLEFKTGTYTSLATWETQNWNEERLSWVNGSLVQQWAFSTDWKPYPYSPSVNGPGWEPVFHAALYGPYVYVPGFGGTVYQLRKADGSVVSHINPFGTVDPHTFSSGPITVDPQGNIYYITIKLSAKANINPWDVDVINSWLVKVDNQGHTSKATITSLTPGAPPGNGNHCLGVFNTNHLPWPPSPNAVPDMVPCGTQRAALNSAPAVGPDGTIYLGTVAHLWSREAYLVAANPDLSPKWNTSLRDRLHDGCNVLLPPNGTPNGCAVGAQTGFDPAQNRPGAGRIIDDGTSSPVVTPDGSILFGAFTRYNYDQGHIMKFSPSGQFLAAYPFGWDDTPAVYAHDGTWSVLTKDNQYGDEGSYCDDATWCPPDRTTYNPAYPEAYYMTQLDSNLNIEWRYQNTNTESCTRNPNGSITCVSDHPAGFEWCVNAPAIDQNGTLYANSEDGNLYEIFQGGAVRSVLFLNLAVGAAYTPVSVAPDGKVYNENFGTMFVVGANGH